ncbi:MAG: hypothetical protein RL033_733 [Pseudomonadota bacterium]|jgi:hypothetical protein
MHLGFEVEDRGSAACSQLITDGLVCYEYYVVELSRPWSCRDRQLVEHR